jgi:DNA-binding NarL/FixJ family response regulator
MNPNKLPKRIEHEYLSKYPELKLLADSDIAGKSAEDVDDSIELTRRESDSVGLIMLGLTDIQIAEKTYITESTVKLHNSTVYEKIGASNRREAAFWAFRQGWIEKLISRDTEFAMDMPNTVGVYNKMSFEDNNDPNFFKNILNENELEIIRLILQGKFSNAEIAEKTHLSENGVKHNATNIYKKFGLSSREELLTFAAFAVHGKIMIRPKKERIFKETASATLIPHLSFEDEQKIFEKDNNKVLLDKKILATIRLLQQTSKLVNNTASLRDVSIRFNNQPELDTIEISEVDRKRLKGVDPMLLNAVLSILAKAESTKELMKDPELFQFAHDSAIRELVYVIGPKKKS